MCLSEEIPYESRANPHARDQMIKRANLYEHEMVETYCGLNRSGASPSVVLGGPLQALRFEAQKQT